MIIYVADFNHYGLPVVLLLEGFAFPYVILAQYFATMLVDLGCDMLSGEAVK